MAIEIKQPLTASEIGEINRAASARGTEFGYYLFGFYVAACALGFFISDGLPADVPSRINAMGSMCVATVCYLGLSCFFVEFFGASGYDFDLIADLDALARIEQMAKAWPQVAVYIRSVEGFGRQLNKEDLKYLSEWCRLAEIERAKLRVFNSGATVGELE